MMANQKIRTRSNERTAMKKRFGVLDVLAILGMGLLALVVATAPGCGEKSSQSVANPLGAVTGATALEEGSSGTHTDSRLPPIRVPDGVTCPSDAPTLFVTAQHGHLLIEWSQIPRVSGYEVEIERWDALNKWVAHRTVRVGDSDESIDVQPGYGFYRVRVRSLRCGGFGNWSSFVTEPIDEPAKPPAPKPPVDPCEDAKDEISLATVSGPVCP